jgi:hypothetical protein
MEQYLSRIKDLLSIDVPGKISLPTYAIMTEKALFTYPDKESFDKGKFNLLFGPEPEEIVSELVWDHEA